MDLFFNCNGMPLFCLQLYPQAITVDTPANTQCHLRCHFWCHWHCHYHLHHTTAALKFLSLTKSIGTKWSIKVQWAARKMSRGKHKYVTQQENSWKPGIGNMRLPLTCVVQKKFPKTLVAYFVFTNLMFEQQQLLPPCRLPPDCHFWGAPH